MSQPGRSGLLYHLLMALGFIFLVAAFYLMQYLNFTGWVASLGPVSHQGAFKMVAVMIWMTPAFLAWKHYVRFINRRLEIQGRYYEDTYYGTQPDNATPKPSNEGAQQDTTNDDRT
ncbi:hypothetical protein [Motiliproteus sp. SC1-56]|uniref:hypothetical protein n=1 Tax=Motiliproteus sp. SC1-56 TaxID=2799565 RepID=UPI001A8DE173|nr:hypothetical protein [Motiliproteus sp. SC1-56]